MKPWRLGAVALSTLIAGCGGGSSGAGPTGIDTTTTAAAPMTAPSAAKPLTKRSPLAFARCMRAHGVPNFPDPRPLSQLPATNTMQPAPAGGFTANPHSPAYQRASRDCNSLAVATQVSQGQQNQVRTAQLKFAVCMRAHGVPNYPDPTPDGDVGNDGAISGVNPSSPAYQGAEEHCSNFQPRETIPKPPGA